MIISQTSNGFITEAGTHTSLTWPCQNSPLVHNKYLLPPHSRHQLVLFQARNNVCSIAPVARVHKGSGELMEEWIGDIDHFEDIPINVFKLVNATVLGVVKDQVNTWRIPEMRQWAQSLGDGTADIPLVASFCVIQKNSQQYKYQSYDESSYHSELSAPRSCSYITERQKLIVASCANAADGSIYSTRCLLLRQHMVSLWHPYIPPCLYMFYGYLYVTDGWAKRLLQYWSSFEQSGHGAMLKHKYKGSYKIKSGEVVRVG